MFVLVKQYKDESMCARATNWERLNVVNKLFTTTDITARNITSVHTPVHSFYYYCLCMYLTRVIVLTLQLKYKSVNCSYNKMQDTQSNQMLTNLQCPVFMNLNETNSILLKLQPLPFHGHYAGQPIAGTSS